VGCIEQVFPYGHRDHQPPVPADVAALAEVDPAGLSGSEVMGGLDGVEAAQRQLDSVRLGLLGEYAHRGLYAADGAVGAASALEHRHGGDSRVLRQEITVAAKLRHLTLMAKTLAAGRTTAAHMRVLARATTAKTHHAVIADEARLVGWAETLTVDEYRLALRHWKAHADPDGTEDPNAHLRRELHLSHSVDGDWFLKGRLDDETGTTLKKAIDGVLEELWRNRDSSNDQDISPPSQRRADALVELARRGGAVDATGSPHRRTRPQVVVTMDHDNLIRGLGLGQLDGGGTISASAVRRLACDADMIAAVFGSDSELLDLGRKARIVSPAQRLALILRDRGCIFPNCDRPPEWCDAHHVRHWLDHDGPTDLDNLCLVCSKHHHLLHEGGWTLQRGSTGALVFTNRLGLALPHKPRPAGHPDPCLTHPPPEPEPPARRAPREHDE
jgi:hypothetical protein